MNFIADRQTRDDLTIGGRYKPDSLFSLFNKVNTAGGSRLLEVLFNEPLTDAAAINRRSEIFKYFGGSAVRFPFDSATFERAESYLGVIGTRNILAAGVTIGYKRLLGVIVRDEEYAMIQSGLQATVVLLGQLRAFLSSLDPAGPYREKIGRMNAILSDRRLPAYSHPRRQQHELQLPRFSLSAVIRYDRILRGSMQEEMSSLLDMIYELDVCIAVSGVARERGFCYAHVLPKENASLRAEANPGFHVSGLFHPALRAAVGNALSFSPESNVLFLTGANMAGKSTLMKALGIAVYLAHMGFPVAAENMEFRVMDGLYSSINVSDDLGQGYSHFYAEVLRVKKVAEEVSGGRDLVVIFDELFKGTNVKDAYDATLAITAAFAEYRNCFFIISTHIVEVGEVLKEVGGQFQFAYLPSIMDGLQPRYTYQLQEGISADRHGMMIIEKEGILELIS